MASGLFLGQYTLQPPQLLLFEQILLSSAVVGFTKPNSLARFGLLPLVSACTYGVISTSNFHMRSRWASLIGGTSFAFLLQYLDLALLSRGIFEQHISPQETPDRTAAVQQPIAASAVPQESQTVKATASESRGKQDPTFWHRLRLSWSSMFTFRHLYTDCEVKNVPSFSAEDPSYIPTRWSFVIGRVLVAAVCYLVIDLSGSRPPPENSAALFDVALVPLFSRLASVTSGQLKLRVISTIGFWVTLYCVINGGNAVAGAFSVALGLSNVKAWRPTFGYVSDAYTLRNFWGKFWHQSLRRLLTEPAYFVTHKVLPLRKGSFTARYLNLFLTFGLSGILHALAGISSGMPVREYGVIQFFCTQVLGIMIEDGVQACYSRLDGRSGKIGGASPSSLSARCVGYIWVAAFLIWTTPAWLYPRASRPASPGPSGFLPYSLVQTLRS